MKTWFILLLLSSNLLLMAPCRARGAAGPGTASRFFGGAGDGSAHSTVMTYTSPTGGELARYTGGAFDGAANRRLLTWNSAAPGELGRFVGGTFDGADAELLEVYSPPLPGALGRFVGGGHDGYAAGQAGSLANPLSGDTDGDGVPDWWEAWHHQSLTLTERHTDLDGDGEGSRKEYLADTDPLDHQSRFSLTYTGTPPNLTCTARQTSVEREYSLEYSTTLEAGSWITVAGSASLGNGGDLTFPVVSDAGENVYFRATVRVP